MLNGDMKGQPLAQAGILFLHGENVRSRLALRATNKKGRSSIENCLVLTDQRLIYIHDGVTDAEVQSVPLRSVDAGEVTRRRGHSDLILLAGYFLNRGIAYMASLFSNTAGLAIFFVGLAGLLSWWLLIRDTVVGVNMEGIRIEVVVDCGGRREASEFLDHLIELKENST